MRVAGMDTAPCTSLGQKPARQIQIPQPTLTSSPKKTATNRKYNSQLSNRNNGSTVVDLHKQWGHTKTSLPQTCRENALSNGRQALTPQSRYRSWPRSTSLNTTQSTNTVRAQTNITPIKSRQTLLHTNQCPPLFCPRL